MSKTVLHNGKDINFKAVADEISLKVISSGSYNISEDDLDYMISACIGEDEPNSDEFLREAVRQELNSGIDIDKSLTTAIEDLVYFLLANGMDVMVIEMNEDNTRAIRSELGEICNLYHDFTLDNPNTWDNHGGEPYNECVNIVNNYKIPLLPSAIKVSKNKNSKLLLENRAKISDQDIKEIVYNQLDNGSLQLLHGIMTGKFNTDASSFDFNDIKFIIWNHLKNNRNGKVWNVMGSFWEGKEVEVHEMLKMFGKKVFESIQINTSPIFISEGKDGNIYSIKFDEKYYTKKIK